jgi:hypothetical protein
MMRLAEIIERFEPDFLQAYQAECYLVSWKRKTCRSEYSRMMRVACSDCDHRQLIPHACGHRNSPHCQHHESQQCIERQVQKQLPAIYFMITFTLPRELRVLAWLHQKQVYALLFDCAWQALQSFSLKDKQLKGIPGVIAVLHTHSRAQNFHPHIHTVMPAAALDKANRLWRKKPSKYLFNHKGLAKVFRAKILLGLVKLGLSLSDYYPDKWVVDCKSVGSDDKALIYLRRYLYWGVIAEKDILCCEDGQIAFRYIDSDTGKTTIRKVSAATFIWQVLQHVLPRGFRRARNYGFLHPNSKTLIKLIHWLLKFDLGRWLPKTKPRPQQRCDCGGLMETISARIKPVLKPIDPIPIQGILF